MRVVVDATALGSGLGGDETFLRGMLEGLAQVAARDDEFPLLIRPDAPIPFDLVGDARFPTRALAKDRGFAHFAWRLPRALARERGKFDLALSLTHAPLFTRAPYALVLGDLSFVHYPEYYPRSSRLRMNLLAPRQTRAAAAVLTFSEYSRQDMIEVYGLDPARVFAVPCRVDDIGTIDERARADAERWAMAQGVRSPFFLYLGNLHPRKNVPRLIEAFVRATSASEAAAGVQLVIAGARWFGDGPEERLARAAPAGSIVLLGRVEEAVRQWLLGAAMALTYPSIFEGFGLPPVEAMAAATPVLTSDRTSIPEVCGDAALFVDPFDVDAIAGGLVRLATDAALREDLARRGVAQAARYTTEATGHAALTALHAAARVDSTRRNA